MLGRLPVRGNRWFDRGELQYIRPSDAGKIGVTIKGTPFKAISRPGNEVDDDETRPSTQMPLSGLELGR